MSLTPTPRTTTTAAPSTTTTSSGGAAASPTRDALRGMSYNAGAAALSPSVQLHPAHGGGGLLTPAQERSAILYNDHRHFAPEQVRQYQGVVGTTPDGDIGPLTVEAVARFQQSHGLEVDGKIGFHTQAKLEGRTEQHPNTPQPEHDNNNNEPVPAGGLSPNFSLSEFASHDGAPTPASVMPHLRQLAQQLEVLRSAFGDAGIHITSGYRSPAHNRAVGGAKNSEHMQGRAADINVAGHTPVQVKAKILELIANGRMLQGGIGLYSGFVHYDTRGYAARW